MNALLSFFLFIGLVVCANAQFGFNNGFHGGPTVTRTIVTETRPGFGNNGFNGRGPNRGFDNGFNGARGGFNNGFNGPRGGFNNGFGPAGTIRTITTQFAG